LLISQTAIISVLRKIPRTPTLMTGEMKVKPVSQCNYLSNGFQEDFYTGDSNCMQMFL